MRMAIFGLAAAALVLSAAAPPTTSRTNPFNEQLRHLDPLNQAAALRRAVTTSDETCGRVSAYKDDGAYHNLGKWSVRCTPGGDYAVFTGPDGSVQVRDCSTLAGLKLPLCTLPPLPPPSPRRR